MSEAKKPEPRVLPYVLAINEGIRTVLREQDDSFIAGEDVAAAGSVYGYCGGLLDEFGSRRVIDTPISEKGIMGLGVGASATGCRPIIDLMFMDFLGECMDEVANQMAKMRFMFGGKATLPVTVLTMGGAGGGMAAQHSQSLEAWLAHLPGMKVVMPSDAYDAKGMIISACRDDNPVFVVLNKQSLAMSMEVPEAIVRKQGTDLTIVAFGRMVHEALDAAEQLKEVGLNVEVIDARSVQPFDTATVVTSIKKTHRALIVHEAVKFGGIGGEITAQIQEEAFDYLDAPIMRVAAPFSPVPFSPALEKLYIPNAAGIVAKVKETLEL